MYKKYFKRFLDLIFSILLSILFSPIIIIVWLIIKLKEPEVNAIFIQKRCGKGKDPFLIYKFRTMSPDAPSELSTDEFQKADDFISPFGKYLRSTSLDELPQLFNIIKGDMSFVGPRPVIYREKELINKREQSGILDILPGITGLAQVKGRDSLEVEEKVELDKEYKEGLDFWMDIKILFITIYIIFTKIGNKDKQK